MENLFTNQELLWLATISVIFVTLMCDSAAMREGENRCKSLLRVKLIKSENG